MRRNKLSKYILAIALVFSILLTSVTFSRYHSSSDPSTPGFDGNFDLNVTTNTTVNTIDEFMTALKNGYANIKISEDAPNPFVVTAGVTDVSADVIIDLNGHELRRNSRDPMLNIKPGVRMVIADSSTGKTGSFYNPVGSVLMVSGGHLTVNNGTFISGPKPEDYVKTTDTTTSETTPLDTNALAETEFGAKILKDGGVSKPTKFWVRNDDKHDYIELNTASETPDDANASATVAAKPNVPMIIPGVGVTGTAVGTANQINGNMYFAGGFGSVNESLEQNNKLENSVSYELNGNQTPDLFTNDTFLYFTIGDGTEDNTTLNHHPYSKTSANFIYQYQLVKDTDGYRYPNESDTTNKVTVTIFAYNDVKKAAKGESHDNVNVAVDTSGKAVPDFASVKITDGTMAINGGTYHARFGLQETSSIYAAGGELTLSAGGSMNFHSYESAIGINCDFPKNATEINTINVAGGVYNSVDGNSIRVVDGTLNLNGGTFTKKVSGYQENPVATTNLSANEVITPVDSHLNACIYVNGGKVLSDGKIINDDPRYSRVRFDVYGSNLYGIYADNGTVDLTGARFEFAGEDEKNPLYGEDGTTILNENEPVTHNNVGVYMTGTEPGSIKITDCIFYIPSDNSAGIRIDGSGTVESYGSRFLMTGKTNINKGGEQLIAGIHITAEAYIAGGQSTSTTVVLDSMIPGEPGADNRDTTRFYIDNVTQCYGLLIGEAVRQGGIAPKTTTNPDGTTNTEKPVTVNVNSVQFLMGQQPDDHVDEQAVDEKGNITAGQDGYCDTCGGCLNENVANEKNLANGAGIAVGVPGARVNVASCLLLSSGSGYSGIYVNGGSVVQKSRRYRDKDGKTIIVDDETKYADLNNWTPLDKLVLLTGVIYDQVDKTKLVSDSGDNYKGYTNGYITGQTYFTVDDEDYSMSGAGIGFKDENGNWIADDAVGEAIKNIQLQQSGAYRSHGVYVSNGNVTLDNAFLAIYGNNSAAIRSTSTSPAEGEAQLIKHVVARNVDILVYTGEKYKEQKVVNGEPVFDTDGNPVYVVNDDGTNNYLLGSTAISTQTGSILLGRAENEHIYGEAVGMAANDGGAVNIWSDSLCVTASDGNVELAGELDIKTIRGTAIFVYGGEFTLAERGHAEIDSTAIANAIWQQGEGPGSSLVSTDSIYITDGSFYSNGELKINHTGINNGEHTNYNADFISSFALRVEATPEPTTGTANEGGNAVDPNGDAGDIAAKRVVIRQADIVNNCGGGVYVSGGEVVLGYRYEDLTTGVNVKTTGTELSNDKIYPKDPANGTPLNQYSNWQYKRSITGGDAVQVWGGTLNIFAGEFVSKHGQGVQVAGGTANIYGGTFIGEENKPANNDPVAAVAGHYGFKLIDGGTAKVYGGEFYGGNGGAFTIGKGSTSDDVKAQAYIYGGKFATGVYTENPTNEDDKYATYEGNGFTVFDNSEIIFGAMDRNNAETTIVENGVSIPNPLSNPQDFNYDNPDEVESTRDISKDIAHALHRYFGIPLGSESDRDELLPGQHVQNHIDNIDNKTKADQPDGKCDYCDEEFHRDNYKNTLPDATGKKVGNPKEPGRDYLCDQCGKHFHTFIDEDKIGEGGVHEEGYGELYHEKRCDGHKSEVDPCQVVLHYDIDGDGECDYKNPDGTACGKPVQQELESHKDLQYHLDITNNGRCDNCGVLFWTCKQATTEDGKLVYVDSNGTQFIFNDNYETVDPTTNEPIKIEVNMDEVIYHTAYENSETYVQKYRTLQIMSKSTALAVNSINVKNNITTAPTNISIDVYEGYFYVKQYEKNAGSAKRNTIWKNVADAKVRIFNVEIRGSKDENRISVPIPLTNEKLEDIERGVGFTYLHRYDGNVGTDDDRFLDKVENAPRVNFNNYKFLDNLRVSGTGIGQYPIMVQMNGYLYKFGNYAQNKPIYKEGLVALVQRYQTVVDSGGYIGHNYAWYKEPVEGVTAGDPWYNVKDKPSWTNRVQPTT